MTFAMKNFCNKKKNTLQNKISYPGIDVSIVLRKRTYILCEIDLQQQMYCINMETGLNGLPPTIARAHKGLCLDPKYLGYSEQPIQLYLNIPSIAGLDLENYFPTKCSYDSVVYVHKKFLPQYKDRLQKNQAASKLKRTWDKSQQFDSENLEIDGYKVKEKIKHKLKKDPVVEHAIRFAKTIIPLTIPPSTDVSPNPEYTIKAIKKSKKKASDPNHIKCQSVKEGTYTKEKNKNIIDHFICEKLKTHKDRISERETVSSSRDNTLDDINENRTLSCSLSEISERKRYKENRYCKRNKRNEMQKVAVSDSFEAVANEFMNTSSETKIKIHLMNDREKKLLYENIQTPIIGAVKECIMQLNNENLVTLQRMQTSIEHQRKQMDIILDKLTSFEEKLEFCMIEKPWATEPSKPVNPSKSEELSAEIYHVKQVNSSDEEELGQIDLLNRSVQNKSVDGQTFNDKNILRSERRKIENLGCGEEVPARIRSQLGFKTDKPNRVPARFCWTDAGKI